MKKRKYIIVDEDSRPMSFQSPQLCYVYTRGSSRFYLKTYTEKQANEIISKTIEYRNKKNFSIGEYYLMPIYDAT